jgi:hypothetical protein
MSETKYWQCETCFGVEQVDAKPSSCGWCNRVDLYATFVPVEVLPVGELSALRSRCDTMRVVLAKCIDQLQKEYDNEECECPPEGHMCGRDQRGWELKAYRAALLKERGRK